jgi:hypothetical protein
MHWWQRVEARLQGRSVVADTAVLVSLAVVAVAYLSTLLHPPETLGYDLSLYQRQVQSWLGGAPLYPPYELAGPYVIERGAILYPPITIALFAPTLLLPLPLWWLIPAAIIGTVVYRLRPRPWAIVTMACCLVFPTSYTLVLAGNPDLWLVAALAAALSWRPAAAFVLLKPSVLPFALIGIRSRGWWLIAGLFALVSLALLPQTLDWFRAITNGRGARSGWMYSLHDVPLLLVPFVAWLGSKRRPRDCRSAAGAEGCGRERADDKGLVSGQG